jgi:1-acyl-sn-glycerol-3-phosphate acyltransferase
MINNLEHLIASGLCATARLITGVRAIWRGCAPLPRQRIYFANHRSHFDFILIWSTLPQPMRRMSRPVAAIDYWGRHGLRHYLITRVFNGVLIDRNPPSRHTNPLQPMVSALAGGDSLILFPEGTRNAGDDLLPFKPGLFHLAREFPEVELVPVWIENVGRVMPKGAMIPVPLICSLSFGVPVNLAAGESKPDFLERARQTLLALAPPPN